MNRLGTLISREMRQSAIYVAGLIGAAFVTVGIVLVQVPAQFHLPLSVALERSLPTPLAFGLIGVMQLVQITVLKEKTSGGFLFLRMLPVNDSEIISSKLFAILLDTLIICGVPMMALGGATIYFHIGFPKGYWLISVWVCILTATLAVGMTACAIQFDSQRALLFPLVVFLAFFGLGFVVWEHLPISARLALWIGIQSWAIVLAAGAIWLGWVGTIHLFSKRDFAELSE